MTKEEFMDKVSVFYDENEALVAEDDEPKFVAKVIKLQDMASAEEVMALVELGVIAHLVEKIHEELDNGKS